MRNIRYITYQIIKILIVMLIALTVTWVVFSSFQEGINTASTTQATPTRLTMKTGDDVEYNGWWVCYEGRQWQIGSSYNYHIRILSRSSSIRWYDLTFILFGGETIHFIGTDFKVISQSDTMLVLEVA